MDRKNDKNNKEVFENMPVPSALSTMAVPTIMGQLIVLIYNLADTFYVGRTNNPYMVAGASLILPVYNITLSLAGLAGVGGGSLISRPLVAYNYAAGNTKRMKDLISFSRLTGILVGIGSVIMYELLAGQIMRLFIADAETVALGTDFLRARCVATPLMFLSFFHVYLFRSFGRGKISLFLGIMRWAVFNIPMLFILNALTGMYGIVWSQVTADVLTVTLSVAVWLRFSAREFAGGSR